MKAFLQVAALCVAVASLPAEPLPVPIQPEGSVVENPALPPPGPSPRRVTRVITGATIAVVSPQDSTAKRTISESPAESPAGVTVLGRWWIKDGSRNCAFVLQQNGTISCGNDAVGDWTLASEDGSPLLNLKWNDGSAESAAMLATDQFRGNGTFKGLDLRRDALPGPRGAGDVKISPAALRLEKELSGTTWEWGGVGSSETIEFRPDGTVENSGWTFRRLVTGWEAKSGDTVRLTILQGRDDMRFAVLVFSENHESYTGTAFDGKILPASHPKRSAAALQLEKQLTSTTWEWGGPASNETIEFRPDGTVENPGWTHRGLVTDWEAKSGDVVRLEILKGRTDMLYADLIFSEDHARYTGTSFDGKPISASHQIK